MREEEVVRKVQNALGAVAKSLGCRRRAVGRERAHVGRGEAKMDEKRRGGGDREIEALKEKEEAREFEGVVCRKGSGG